MDEPILEASRIPTILQLERVVEYELPDLPGILPITCVSMGSPHLVMFCEDLSSAPLKTVGPVLERSAWFPNRINVHYAQVLSREAVSMVSWERGSGVTLACGTGACSVVVAGVLTGRLGRHVTVHVSGGTLEVEWRESNNHVYMTGPAVEVFSGEWAE